MDSEKQWRVERERRGWKERARERAERERERVERESGEEGEKRE